MEINEIKKLINDTIDSKLRESTEFRRWNPLDSVTDQFSPITGASQMIGFFGTPKVSRPTVTGSKGANAALTSFIAAASVLGLIIDNTS